MDLRLIERNRDELSETRIADKTAHCPWSRTFIVHEGLAKADTDAARGCVQISKAVSLQGSQVIAISQFRNFKKDGLECGLERRKQSPVDDNSK